MEEIALVEVLRRRMSMIATLCIVAALAGYGLSFVVSEKYNASALVLVRPHEPIKLENSTANKEFLDFPVGPATSVETPAKTYIKIIESPGLIGRVVRELKLDQKPEDHMASGGSLFARISAGIRAAVKAINFRDLVALVKYGRVIRDDPFTKAVKDVTKALTLTSYEDTYVFEIKYGDEKPQTAADVANAVARLFIEFMEKMRSSEAKYVGDQLESELEQSRQRLVSARKGLENFKASHRIFLYKPEYDAKLRVISDLEVELAKVDEGLAGSQGTLSAKTYLAKRARLLEFLDARRAELAALPAIERELELREADVDVAGTAYDTVAKELKDAEIKRSDPVPEARLISPAVAPRLPSFPRRGIVALASLLTGLMVGVALALFLEYIDRRVRRIDDVEDFVGLKVIATIPRV